ncbi:hypothetical protein D3C84_1136990 [compost metagenome]
MVEHGFGEDAAAAVGGAEKQDFHWKSLLAAGSDTLRAVAHAFQALRVGAQPVPVSVQHCDQHTVYPIGQVGMQAVVDPLALAAIRQ